MENLGLTEKNLYLPVWYSKRPLLSINNSSKELSQFLYKRVFFEEKEYEAIKEELTALGRSKLDFFEKAISYKNLPKEYISHLPTLIEWFNQHSLKVRYFGTYSTKPTRRMPAHVDDSKNVLALNFPILNCENSATRLFYSQHEPIFKFNTETRWYSFEENSLEEIANFDLKTPVLFNTRVPHAVENMSDSLRVSATFRFEEDPLWMLK